MSSAAKSSSSATPLVIRALQPGDRAEWNVLFAGYITFYEAAVSDAVIDATFARLVDPGRDDMLGLVAQDAAAALVGLAHAVFHPSTWAANAYCYLEDLYVAPDARGSGAGRRLIEAVYAEADRRGASRTYWVTRTDNARARRLYDRLATPAPFVQYRR